PNDLGDSFVAALVASFSERHPRVEVDVELSMRQVNLVQEGFDVALRVSDRLRDSSLLARKAGELHGGLYASPGYLSTWGAPASLAELDAHRCLLFRPEQGQACWTLHGAEGQVERRVRGRIGADDHSFLRGAALAGAGIGILPHLIAVGDLAAGRLVRVLPQYTARGASLYVVYAAARALPAKIAAFRDFVLQTCSNALPVRAPERPPAREPPAATGAGKKPPKAKRTA